MHSCSIGTIGTGFTPPNPPWKGGALLPLLLSAFHCRGTRTVRASAFQGEGWGGVTRDFDLHRNLRIERAGTA